MAVVALAGASLLLAGCSSGAGTRRAVVGAASSTTTTVPEQQYPALDPPVPAEATPPPLAADWYGQPGDGVWADAGRTVGVATAVRTTNLRQGDQVLSAAWISAAHTSVSLYAGTSQPAGNWSNDGAVPPSLQDNLLATFNGGFQLDASEGGWYADGRQAFPLRDGAASLVIRADGSATVAEWGRDASLTPDVVAVRQNLKLLVDGGAVTALSASPSPNQVWGQTLFGRVLTWRSALGIDSSGDLIYLAGPNLDPPTLAAAMVAVGGVRAMQLDINPMWVSFDSLTGTIPAVAGTKLIEGMNFPPDHFLSPFWRDFVAVFAR